MRNVKDLRYLKSHNVLKRNVKDLRYLKSHRSPVLLHPASYCQVLKVLFVKVVEMLLKLWRNYYYIYIVITSTNV